MKKLTSHNSSVQWASRLIVFLLLLCARNLVAQTSAVEGMVKDPNGRPIAGANVRIEARNGKSWNRQVKCDARGHYTLDGLAPGTTYRVTLLIDGSAKAS